MTTFTGLTELHTGLAKIVDAVEDSTILDGLDTQVTTQAADRINTRTGELRGSIRAARTAQGITITADTTYASHHNTGARTFPGVGFLTAEDTTTLATAQATTNLDALIDRHLKD